MAMPAVASADATKPDKAGDVKGKGLGAKDRRALDIVSLEATTNTFGVLLTATMRGDVEDRLGSGRLKRGAVALVVRPDGPGKARILAVDGKDRTVTNFRGDSETDAVVSDREVTFVVTGVDLDEVRRLQVVSLATTARRRRGASHAGIRGFNVRFVTRAVKRARTDAAALGAASLVAITNIGPPVTCAELGDLLEELNELADDLGSSSPALPAVEAQEERVAQEIVRRCGSEPGPGPEFLRLAMNICSGPHGGPTSPANVRGEASRERASSSRLLPPLFRPGPLAQAADASAAGASMTVRITGPSDSAVVGDREKTVTLDSQGRGDFNFTIREFGEYRFDAEARTSDGVTGTASQTFEVGPGQSCPA